MDVNEKTRERSTGVILAGGKSSRFGREKAFVTWQGKALVEHVSESLSQVCGEVIVVTRGEKGNRDWPVDRVVFDDPDLPPCPLRGIVKGLSETQTECAFIAGSDSPLLQVPLLELLATEMREACAAVLPVWGGTLQPLIGYYRKDACTTLLQKLKEGETSPTNAVRELEILALPEERCRDADPRGLSFINVNTPLDLERLTTWQT